MTSGAFESRSPLTSVAADATGTPEQRTPTTDPAHDRTLATNPPHDPPPSLAPRRSAVYPAAPSIEPRSGRMAETARRPALGVLPSVFVNAAGGWLVVE